MWLYITRETISLISLILLTPSVVITILLTIFCKLDFTSSWLFCNCQFVLLNPFTFSPISLTTSPSSNHQHVLCIYEYVCVHLSCFVLFFVFLFILYLDSIVGSYVFIVYCSYFLSSSKRRCFNISFNADLGMVNSFSFFLSGKSFTIYIWPQAS